MNDFAKRKQRPESGKRFPFIPLLRAIERARELYKIANVHEVPIGTAVKAWQYAEKSSGGLQTAAALKSFGLIEEASGDGPRKIKLTDMALKIIRDPRDISPDRDSLIKQSALLPPIHSEIITKYSGLPPSDDAFKAYLLMDKGLADDSVNDFIKEFTATMSFAKIGEGVIIQDMDCELDSNNGQKLEKSPLNPPPVPERNSPWNKLMQGERELTKGLLSKDSNFRLIVSGQIGVKEIEMLIKKLELDKEILAVPDEDDLSDIM